MNLLPIPSAPAAGEAHRLVCFLVSALALLAPAAGVAEPAPLPEPSPLRLVVNVPAYRLDAYLDETRVASWPVTIGSRREPTPTGHFQIERLVWNPWWYPTQQTPKDVVTPPGPHNPMGRVKLHFAADFYIHGTALHGEIGRATSRGCVRLRNADAIALARLVHANAGAPIDADELETLVRHPSRTRHLALARPVRVSLVYEPVEVRDGGIALHGDVYDQLQRPLPGPRSFFDLALAALTRAGFAAETIDHGRLAALVARRSPKPVPVATVLVDSAASSPPAADVGPAELRDPGVAPAAPARGSALR